MEYLAQFFKYDNEMVTCGLTSELNVFYVLNLFNKEKKNIIVLTSSLYEANNYYNLLQTYTEDVLLFITDDFISSLIKAESPELKLTRLNTLEKLKEKNYIIVVNLMAFLKYLPSLKEEEKRHLTLEKNMNIKRDDLIQVLIDNGYHRDVLTNYTGEFSVRGLIVDVFLINEEHPIRIEFDDNIIDNIRYFNESSQSSLKEIDKIVINPVDEIISSEKSSLYDYALKPIVVKIDNPQIMATYKKLQEDIDDV